MRTSMIDVGGVLTSVVILFALAAWLGQCNCGEHEPSNGRPLWCKGAAK